MKVGDRVAIPHMGLVGTVKSIDPRSTNLAPCPCCGLGVAVEITPDEVIGVAPDQCVVVAHGALFIARGGIA